MPKRRAMDLIHAVMTDHYAAGLPKKLAGKSR
jgi:hypothetical protein